MSYLAVLNERRLANARPSGSVANKSRFARVYNYLLSSQARLTYVVLGCPSTRRTLCDGAPLTKSVLAQFRLQCAQAGIPASLEDVRQAALALAVPDPKPDPWVPAIEALLAAAVAQSAGLAPDVWDEGPVARISMYGEPFWFVAIRDIRLRLGARGRDATMRIRLALSDLGWRGQRCFAWGRRSHGFVRPRPAPTVS
jgi:hypothetical protein